MELNFDILIGYTYYTQLFSKNVRKKLSNSFVRQQNNLHTDLSVLGRN